jgi:hypothetical protein
MAMPQMVAASEKRVRRFVWMENFLIVGMENFMNGVLLFAEKSDVILRRVSGVSSGA